MLVFQAGDLLRHLFGFTGEVFVVIDATPGGQPPGAGADPVDLLLLGLMAQRGAFILFLQCLTGSAAGQGEAVQRLVAEDPAGISYSIQ